MRENRHTREFLIQLQHLPLDIKIAKTKQRIREWVQYFGTSGVYVSFSGGKDSTILLDIARQEYPDIEAVFVDTGLEYPEIRDFVKGFENVIWLRPKMSFREVIFKHGYPIVSKEVARKVCDARRGVNNAVAAFDGKDAKGNETTFRKRFKKWKFLLDSDFLISSECCEIIKKAPLHEYEKDTDKKPILGTMTCESELRQKVWLQNGCNAFESARALSTPMSFWLERDILEYIKIHSLPVAGVYGELKEHDGHLKFSGTQRTGCMFCVFGCHLEKSPNRFQKMAKTHPKQYDYCIRSVKSGGLGLGKVLDYIGVDYIPD